MPVLLLYLHSRHDTLTGVANLSAARARQIHQRMDLAHHIAGQDLSFTRLSFYDPNLDFFPWVDFADLAELLEESGEEEVASKIENLESVLLWNASYDDVTYTFRYQTPPPEGQRGPTRVEGTVLETQFGPRVPLDGEPLMLVDRETVFWEVDDAQLLFTSGEITHFEIVQLAAMLDWPPEWAPLLQVAARFRAACLPGTSDLEPLDRTMVTTNSYGREMLQLTVPCDPNTFQAVAWEAAHDPAVLEICPNPSTDQSSFRMACGNLRLVIERDDLEPYDVYAGDR